MNENFLQLFNSFTILEAPTKLLINQIVDDYPLIVNRSDKLIYIHKNLKDFYQLVIILMFLKYLYEDLFINKMKLYTLHNILSINLYPNMINTMRDYLHQVICKIFIIVLAS
jgi:hypothetical protein